MRFHFGFGPYRTGEERSGEERKLIGSSPLRSSPACVSGGKKYFGIFDLDIAFFFLLRRRFELEPSSEVVLSGASGCARAQVPASSQQPAAMAPSWVVRCDVPRLEGIDNLLAPPPALPNWWTAYRS